MTAVQIPIVFEQSLTTPGGVVWLADQLLVLAQHSESMSVEETETEFVGHCGESSVVLASSYKRLFRPLLARLAKVAADESGTSFQPYRGSYSIRRAGDSGPVRLEIEIENTPKHQSLRVQSSLLSDLPNLIAPSSIATSVPVA